MKAATDIMNGHVYAPVKLYSQKQVWAGFGPWAVYQPLPYLCFTLLALTAF